LFTYLGTERIRKATNTHDIVVITIAEETEREGAESKGEGYGGEVYSLPPQDRT
jgi:hypothetical protein